jgi:hypothetical protein
MRQVLLAVLMTAGISLMGVATASAVPASSKAISQTADNSSLVTKVAGGCGRGWHRGPRGRCVP